MKPKRKCRFCGANIFYIENPNPNGGPFPADAKPILYVPDSSGQDLIVTHEGKMLNGDVVPEKVKGCKLGYISHFATCPVPDRVRREYFKKKKEEPVTRKRDDRYEQLTFGK